MTSYLKGNNSAKRMSKKNNWLLIVLIEAFILFENAFNQWRDVLDGILVRTAGTSRIVNADNGRKHCFERRIGMPRREDGGGAGGPREADENHGDVCFLGMLWYQSVKNCSLLAAADPSNCNK
mmetsp:Transcript_25642/g.51438  ORF Transcript_25642/g.51438 Transcript_25642/m.51438 type:complete len:123 (-) Transcript_25642:110-478(-)